MGLFYVAYNGYVWKALFLYRHPERSRGIFLVHRYSAVCVIAENGNASVKGTRKRGVQGRFLDCARNDGMRGMGLFHAAYNGYVWKAPLPQRHPERSRGIFFAGGDNVVCVKAENENASAKEARKRGVQGRFLAALEMTVGGIEKSKKHRMAASGFICFFIPRLRKPILR